VTFCRSGAAHGDLCRNMSNLYWSQYHKKQSVSLLLTVLEILC